MNYRQRFLIAILAVFVPLAPAAFANGGTKTPVPFRAKNDGPYRAKKSKKTFTRKPMKPGKVKSFKRSGR